MNSWKTFFILVLQIILLIVANLFFLLLKNRGADFEFRPLTVLSNVLHIKN